MKTTELVQYLDDFLEASTFKDYAPNGLQVEGKSAISKVVTGVTACQALIDAAIKEKADAIIVHHGYFWKNEPVTITGMKQKRIQSLLGNEINLLGYHLPLDAHPTLGNNAMLGELWSLEDITPEAGLVRLGRLSSPVSIEAFIETVGKTLDRMPLHLPGGQADIETVAWCSGGAQGYIEKAIEWGADVYISGEVSEQTTHQALENQIHYLAAGHHATERLGVKALGEHLSQAFDLEVIFVDIDNPV